MPNLQDGRRLSTLKTEPLRNFKFLVSFSPVGSFSSAAVGTDLWDETTMGGFTSVSGLSASTEPISYREGGYNANIHQVPGMTTFAPISMQRGVMLGNAQALQSLGRVFSATSGTRAASVANDDSPNYRYNISIVVLKHPRDPGTLTDPENQHAMKFVVYNAWLASVTYSDLNAGENGLLVEQIAWVHEGWEAGIRDAPAANGAFWNDGSVGPQG